MAKTTLVINETPVDLSKATCEASSNAASCTRMIHNQDYNQCGKNVNDHSWMINKNEDATKSWVKIILPERKKLYMSRVVIMRQFNSESSSTSLMCSKANRVRKVVPFQHRPTWKSYGSEQEVADHI